MYVMITAILLGLFILLVGLMYAMITAILLGVFYFIGRLDVCHDHSYFARRILFHW